MCWRYFSGAVACYSGRCEAAAVTAYAIVEVVEMHTRIGASVRAHVLVELVVCAAGKRRFGGFIVLEVPGPVALRHLIVPQVVYGAELSIRPVAEIGRAHV